MSIARNLERRLERLVEGISATLFRGKMHPVDLANRLVREADLAVVEGPAGPAIPNDYEIRIGPSELEAGSIERAVLAELEHAVAATAAERGWRLEGPVRVRVTVEAGVAAGGEVTVATVVGPIPPWGRLVGSARTFDVCPNRAVVGRDPAADIRITGAATSRRHALMWREAGRAWVVDLGSANGTRVDGQPIEGPAELTDGKVLTFGDTTLTYRPATRAS